MKEIKNKIGNPLSELISDDIYELLSSHGLIDEKSVRDFQIRKKYIILISILILLIVIRIILPYVVLHYANKTLANLDSYYGHIEDVDISLYRGAYIIKNIYLNKDDPVTKKQTKFFKSRDI